MMERQRLELDNRRESLSGAGLLTLTIKSGDGCNFPRKVRNVWAHSPCN
jgi:hypothetical protein